MTEFTVSLVFFKLNIVLQQHGRFNNEFPKPKISKNLIKNDSSKSDSKFLADLLKYS